MNQMTLCLLLFALMIVLFFIKKIPMSFSAMLIVVLLVVTGCVESKTRREGGDQWKTGIPDPVPAARRRTHSSCRQHPVYGDRTYAGACGE